MYRIISSYAVLIEFYIIFFIYRNGSDPPKIDKQKLFEIARKNAISMSEQGSLPESVVPITDDKIALINSGGRTVDELTS